MGLRSDSRSCRSRLGLPKNGANVRPKRPRSRNGSVRPKLHVFLSSAADALERIEITQDVRDRIAERLWIGGSLIISDQPLSGETGPVGTDLTVRVR